MLRAAREATGMHIEALAVSLKVPVSKLRALEADDFQLLPDTVFARALAGSVCRALKMDPTPVLALMPAGQAPRLEPQAPDVNTAFRDGTEPSRVGPALSFLTRPVFLVVALLLAGAGILAFFPGVVGELVSMGERVTALASPTEPAPAEPSKESLPVMVTPAPSKPTAPESVVEPASPAQSTASVAQAAPVADAPNKATVEGEALLALRAKSASWIQVRDASGATTLQRLVAAGETVVAEGKPPLSVVIGKADATEVFVRGKPMDLAPLTRENVARFEVKP
ncbi:MAG: RodZ domain-containing protein [Giesbergeria sp.]